MASSAILVSVEEYLNTSYSDGDREFVDGVVLERNLGEKDHSTTQKRFIVWFWQREKSEGLYALQEQRIQVKAARFRVPDVCVYTGGLPDEQVFHTPPFLVIEVLSRDDRASDTQEKIDDYLLFGVRYVWIVDPRRRKATVHTTESAREVRDGFLRTEDPLIALPLSYLFE